MNLRCMYCQTLFGVSRDDMLIALQTIQAESLTHYDFHCPKCRRANRVERVKVERAYPNWQETVKAMAAEAASAGEGAAPAGKKPTPAAPKKAKVGPEKKTTAKGKAK